ncbi:hypothetical protein L7F22_062295 [Adiantum nelumboides]|nr:hypothetical protein [Adiantum nelumboides]
MHRRAGLWGACINSEQRLCSTRQMLATPTRDGEGRQGSGRAVRSAATPKRELPQPSPSQARILKNHLSQLRFSLHTPLAAVKERLSQNSGTAVGSMLLHLFDESDDKVCDMINDTRVLGFYSALEGFCIHVVDLDPTSCTTNGWHEDTSLVEKYTITNVDYDKREDTF